MNKVIRDIIHNYIHVDHEDLKIIETPLFQRLKRIKTGLHSYVYPSANYTRFEHSLGVAHLATEICRSLLDKALSDPVKEILQSKRKVVKYAALLHDIGQAPFSHIGEVFFDTNVIVDMICKCLQANYGEYTIDKDAFVKKVPHELMSAYIVLADGKINSILRDEIKFEKEDILLIFDMITGNYNISDSKDPKNVLIQILHSSVDADRLDYILRDNRMTAGDFFALDSTRLIKAYVIHANLIMLDRHALSCVSNFIYGRSAIYEWVVNHHKNILISGIYSQYIEDLLKYESENKSKDLGLPSISKCFSYEGITEELADDIDLLWSFKKYRNTIDRGKTYCEHIFDRQCFKPLWKTGLEFSMLYDKKSSKSTIAAMDLEESLETCTRYGRLLTLESGIVQNVKIEQKDIYAFKCRSRFYKLVTSKDTGNRYELVSIYDDRNKTDVPFDKCFPRTPYGWQEDYFYVFIRPDLYDTHKEKIVKYLFE